MNNKLYAELQAYLNKLSTNIFDCGGFGNLPRNNREWIRNKVVSEIDKMLGL